VLEFIVAFALTLPLNLEQVKLLHSLEILACIGDVLLNEVVLVSL